LVMSGSPGPPLAPLAPLPGPAPTPAPAPSAAPVAPQGVYQQKVSIKPAKRMPTKPLKIGVWVAGVEVEDEQAAVVAHTNTRHLSS
jgi:hypothetical protein